MKSLKIKKLPFAVLSLVITLTSYAQSERNIVIECAEPGSLQLTPEMVLAEKVTVRGTINAIDLATLKKLRNSMRELDLTDANIVELMESRQGTYSYNSSGDISYNPNRGIINYPANYIPVHLFTSHMSNTINKWYDGSKFVHTLTLPKTCEGFMDDALLENHVLSNIIVPDDATHLKGIDGAVYSADMKTLLMLPNFHPQGLDIPETVDSIKSGIFSNRMAYLKFNSSTPPRVETQGIDVAYIIAPNPEAYQLLFPGIDIVSEIQEIEVDGVSEGNVVASIINKGYRANEIRSVKLSGTATAEDINNLFKLPNLHYADLSNVTVTDENANIVISAPLCDLKLPQGKCEYQFVSTYICSDLELPDDAVSVTATEKRSMNPRSIAGGRGLTTYQCTESMPNLLSVDLSRCENLTTFQSSSQSNNVETLLLPPNLKELKWFYSNAPIHTISVPGTVEEMRVEGWLIDELEVPSSVTSLELKGLRYITELDLHECVNLTNANLLTDCPGVKRIDLSNCKINTLSGFESTVEIKDELTEENAMVPGNNRLISAVTGDRHPAPLWCGVEDIKMPTTLKNFNGDIPQFLTELDFTPCYQFEKYSFGTSDKLSSLKLPASVTEISISDLTTLPNLENITLCSLTPPTIQEEVDFGNIELNVPIGCSTLYLSTPIWWSAKKVNEVGYVCILTSDIENAMLFGNGIYANGENVHINGARINRNGIEYSIKSWTELSTGEVFEGEELDFQLQSNSQFFAHYAPTEDISLTANIVLTLENAEATTQQIEIRVIGENLLFFLNNDPIEPTHDYSNYYLAVVEPGKNVYSIVGDIEEIHCYRLDVTLRDITFNECKSLESISFIGIENLFDLDLTNCPSIKSIDIYDCELQTLTLPQQIPALKELSLRSTNLTELSLEGCDQLRSFVCENNKITKLDLSGKSNLEWINIGEMPLTEINLSGCKSLESFYYYNSKELEKLDVTECENMKELSCPSTGITELDLQGCYALERLYCHFCNIESLNVQDCWELKDLSCGENRLVELDLSNNHQLSNLDIYRNSIKTLMVSPMVEYETLNIEENCFAFSCLSDNMYEYITRDNATAIWFKIPEQSNPRIIDLSNELYALNGTPSTINLTYTSNNGEFYNVACNLDEDGAYKIDNDCQAGFFSVTITNDYYPNIKFWSHPLDFDPNDSGICDPTNENIKLNGLQVSVDSNNTLSLYDDAGRLVATGQGVVTAPKAGVYVLTTSRYVLKLYLK